MYFSPFYVCIISAEKSVVVSEKGEKEERREEKEDDG